MAEDGCDVEDSLLLGAEEVFYVVDDGGDGEGEGNDYEEEVDEEEEAEEVVEEGRI